MPQKKYEVLLDALKKAKKVEATGFSDETQVKTYLEEKEGLLASAAEAIEELAAESDAQIGALKTQVEAITKSLKEKTEVKELDHTAMLANLGKLVSAQFRKEFDVVAELGSTPQMKTGPDIDWTESRNFKWDKDGRRFLTRDPVGSPFGGTTDGQYVINTIYERELIRYATKKSAMMDLVRTIPMAGNTISWPTLDRFATRLYWHTNTQGNPAYREAGKPSFGTRVELTCQTLAGWIPWYDLFQDDIQVNVEIGQLFLEMFAEQYGQEFDYQCLLANSAPFTGIFPAGGYKEHILSGSTPMSVTLDDLHQAPLKVPKEDRVDGMWIVSEDFVTWLASARNAIGDYAWMPPQEGGRPGKIAGHPYVEVGLLPGIAEVKEGEAFAWFGNPKDIWHGNRMGIELRTYRETESNLLHGEEFIRFRKRDGFKVTRPDRAVVLKTRPRG